MGNENWNKVSFSIDSYHVILSIEAFLLYKIFLNNLKLAECLGNAEVFNSFWKCLLELLASGLYPSFSKILKAKYVKYYLKHVKDYSNNSYKTIFSIPRNLYES